MDNTQFLRIYEPLLTTREPKEINQEEVVKALLSGEDVDLRDLGIEEYILESGRVSGKTQHNAIACIHDLISGVGDIWYCRSEDGDIRGSIFTSCLSTINSMGLTYSNKESLGDFKVSYSPFEIICNSTGNRIQFFAINKDINRTKGKEPPTGVLKRVVLEEANEPDEGIYIDALRTTAVRFMRSGSKFIYSFNPPMTKQHWSIEYFNKRERMGAKRIYSNWKDLAENNLLSPATISDILQTQKNDPEFYRYWYMGEIVNLAGLVYPQFKRETHCVSIFTLMANGDRIKELVIGLDEGTVNDSTCATPIAIMSSGRAVVLDLFEYSPTDRTGTQGGRGSLAPSQTAELLYKWFVRLLQTFPNLQSPNIMKRWIFESAEGGQMLRAQFVMTYGDRGIGETFLVTNKSVWGDIKRVRNMLAEGILLFHMAPNVNTEQLVKDIEAYIIDPKTNDLKKNQREDSIDSLEYATKLYYDRPL